MPGKELRDDLSKEEIEGKDYKNGECAQVKEEEGIREKLSERRKRSRGRRSRGHGEEWDGIGLQSDSQALIRDFTESCKDCETDFKLPTVGLFFHLQQRTSVS